MSLPAIGGLKAGDFVNVGLPESGLSLAAMFGYMFPALATLAGALCYVLLAGLRGPHDVVAVVGGTGVGLSAG